MWDLSQDWNLHLELHYNQVVSTLNPTSYNVDKEHYPLKKQKQPQPQK